MNTLKILRIDSDNLRLQAEAFARNPTLAKRARDAFLKNKAFKSFEVSTFSGEVYIGFDASLLKERGTHLSAFALLHTYFPDLDANALTSRRSVRH